MPKLGDRVNPGYLSYLMISVACILLASGWKDILLRGVSHKKILLFFAGWFVFVWFSIPWHGAVIQGVYLYMLALSIAGIIALRRPLLQLHVLLAGILLGMFDFVLLELNGWFPVSLLPSTAMDSAFLLSVIVMLMGRQVVWQFVAVTVGLFWGEGAHHIVHWETLAGQTLGGLRFQDHWWLVFGSTRGLTAALESSWRAVTAAARTWSGRRKHWRE